MPEIVNIEVGMSQRHKCIEMVERLLERCRSGETIGVSFVEEQPGGTYTICSSGTMSRLQTAGALLELAMKRLQE